MGEIRAIVVEHEKRTSQARDGVLTKDAIPYSRATV